jgi:hypothetical protein
MNMWEDFFKISPRDPAAIERIRVIPAPVRLRHLPTTDACNELKNVLETLHVETEAELALMDHILGTARSFCRKYYASEEMFLKRIYEEKDGIEQADQEATLITSDAGVGKSSIQSAVQRLIGGPRQLELSIEGGSSPIIFHGGAFHAIEQNTQMRSVLTALSGQIGISTTYKSSDKTCIESFKRQLYNRGVCFTMFDEFQFLTSSTSANTVLAKFLLLLRSLSRPMFYIGNFSLAHRLLKRPSEDKHRLLSSPWILPSDEPEDPKFLVYLEHLQRILEELIDFPMAESSSDLVYLTGGNRRRMRILLGISFALARDNSRSTDVRVSMNWLRKGYLSSQYSVFRFEVESVRTYGVGSERLPLDLRRPFDEYPGSIAQRKEQKQAQQSRFASDAVRSSLSRSELKALDAQVKQGEVSPPPIASASRTKRRSPPPERTASSLLAGAMR